MPKHRHASSDHVRAEAEARISERDKRACTHPDMDERPCGECISCHSRGVIYERNLMNPCPCAGDCICGK